MSSREHPLTPFALAGQRPLHRPSVHLSFAARCGARQRSCLYPSVFVYGYYPEATIYRHPIMAIGKMPVSPSCHFCPGRSYDADTLGHERLISDMALYAENKIFNRRMAKKGPCIRKPGIYIGPRPCMHPGNGSPSISKCSQGSWISVKKKIRYLQGASG